MQSGILTGIEYLSGNWKTMPTLSGFSNSGDLFGQPSSPYLWIQMEPDVGLLSPAINWISSFRVNTMWYQHRNAVKGYNKNDKI